MTYAAIPLESETCAGYAPILLPTSSFGKNVRRLMAERSLEPRDLLDVLQVKQGTLSDWMRDRRGLPETPTLLKFAKALRVPVEELITGVDDDYDAIVKRPSQSRPAGPVPNPADVKVIDLLRDPEAGPQLRRFVELPEKLRAALLQFPAALKEELEYQARAQQPTARRSETTPASSGSGRTTYRRAGRR